MTEDPCHYHDSGRSVQELRAWAALQADLQWDELLRRREAHEIAVVTASGWVRVARQILIVMVGATALTFVAAGQLDVLELLRVLR